MNNQRLFKIILASLIISLFLLNSYWIYFSWTHQVNVSSLLVPYFIFVILIVSFIGLYLNQKWVKLAGIVLIAIYLLNGPLISMILAFFHGDLISFWSFFEQTFSFLLLGIYLVFDFFNKKFKKPILSILFLIFSLAYFSRVFFDIIIGAFTFKDFFQHDLWFFAVYFSLFFIFKRFVFKKS